MLAAGPSDLALWQRQLAIKLFGCTLFLRQRTHLKCMRTNATNMLSCRLGFLPFRSFNLLIAAWTACSAPRGNPAAPAAAATVARVSMSSESIMVRTSMSSESTSKTPGPAATSTRRWEELAVSPRNPCSISSPAAPRFGSSTGGGTKGTASKPADYPLDTKPGRFARTSLESRSFSSLVASPGSTVCICTSRAAR